MIRIAGQRQNGIEPPAGFRESEIKLGATEFAESLARVQSGGGAASLDGVVRSATGHPFPGALVAVFESEETVSGLTTRSDAEGRFKLAGVPPGRPVSLFAELDKWKRRGRVDDVHFEAGQVRTAKFVLAADKGFDWKLDVGFLERDTVALPDADDSALLPEPVVWPTGRILDLKLTPPVVEYGLPLFRTAQTPIKSSDHIRINVVDSERQSPLREFRVIAGVKSGVSSEVEGVVNWQPHTLRIGRDGVLDWPLDKAYDEMALRIEADGYRPKTSAWMKKAEGAKTVAFNLDPDPGISGRVLTPDGKPAGGAVLALAMVQRDAVIEGGKLRGYDEPEPEKPGDRWRRPVFVKADAEGRFEAPHLDDITAAVLIIHESGVREMRFSEFEKFSEIALQSWGRIDGRVQWRENPGTNEAVSLTVHRDEYGYPGVVAQYEETESDGDGRFVFDKVLPGRVQLSRPHKFAKPTKSGTTSVMLPGMVAQVVVKSDGPTAALIGGRGRTIKGRLSGRDSWDGVTMHFHPRAPHVGLPGDDDMWTAWGEFQKSAIGPIFFRTGLTPNADGTFEIPGVLPGEYQLFVDGNLGYRQFSVDAETADIPVSPLDLGEIAVKPGGKKGAGTTPKKTEAYAASRRVEAMDGWVLAWDVQNPMQHSDGQRSARLRLFPDGRVLDLANGLELRELRMDREHIDELLKWLIDGGRVPEIPPATPGLITSDDAPQNGWDASSSFLTVRQSGRTYRKVHTVGPRNPDDGSFKEIGERLRHATYLAAIGGRGNLARYTTFAEAELRKRHPQLAAELREMPCASAGFDTNGTLAIFFEFGADGPGKGWPHGRMAVRVPPGGEPFIDRAELWRSEKDGDRWGRSVDHEKTRPSTGKAALERARSGDEADQAASVDPERAQDIRASNAAGNSAAGGAISIEVAGDDSLTVGKRVTIEALESELAGIRRTNPGAAIVVRASADDSYDRVVRVLEKLKNAGITSIGLQTRKDEIAAGTVGAEKSESKQWPAIVRGRLVDKAGAPLGKRIVWFVEPGYRADEPGKRVFTDGPTRGDGTFEFELPVGRPWQVLIPRQGTLDGPRSRSVTLAEDTERTIEIRFDGEAIDVKVAETAVERSDDEIEDARTKLDQAETDLKRMAALRAESLVSESQVEQARMNVEALRAELAGENAAAAQARLRLAESEFQRLAALQGEGVVSSRELEQAKFNVEIRKAELRGDAAEAARVRVRQAEQELARIAELERDKLVRPLDLSQARLNVELRKAELAGDAAEVARVRLRQAEDVLAWRVRLHEERLTSKHDLDQARFDVELRKAELAGDSAAVARIKLQKAEADVARAAELRREGLISEAEFQRLKRAAERRR